MANETFKNLDFDQIKADIKTFLSGKVEFQDHNFEGSTWALILDALAYSTHYTSVYANFALSEAFLDTAELRSSVISRAKELGYTPKQITAATATIQLDITGQATGQTLNVPANTKFKATLDNKGFTFQTLAQTPLLEDGATGNYSATVLVSQGFVNSQNFVVSGTPLSDRFVLFDSNVDANTLKVSVDAVDYLLDTNFVEVDSTSTVFFIQEVENEKVEIFFGDGIFGKAVATPGQTIAVSWLSSLGAAANDINVFSLTDTIEGLAPALFTVAPLSRASGGAGRDSIEKIKFTAPKMFAAQNRLVTAQDYQTLLMGNFPTLKSVSIWGGEENVPPLFGKVFVSASIAGFGVLSTQLKAAIIAFLNKFKIMALIPELIDPEFLYLDLDATVTYDNTKTNRAATDIQTDVKAAISLYVLNNLQTFGGRLRLSKLLAAIDGVDPAIADSLIDIKLKKIHQVPASNIPPSLGFDFSDNRLIPGSFLSNTFSGNTFYFDDSLGNVDISVGGVITKGVGVINYLDATVTLNNVVFIPSDTITFRAVPVSANVESKRLNIILEGDITVNTKLVENN